MNLELCKQEKFNGMDIDLYKNNNNEIFMTREQIGKALEYLNPQKSIDKIHQRNKERLDKFSSTVKLEVELKDGRKQERELVLYTCRGVYEICRYSKQPKANEFYDWLTKNALSEAEIANTTQSFVTVDCTSLVKVINNQIVVSSRQVAKNFGKLHKDILENVRQILAAENSATKFYYKDTFENRGKQYPMYYMNRDGFSLLVMGFTGKKALEWKIKYIEAFNTMEKKLKSNYTLPDFTNPVESAIAWAKQYKEKEKYKKELEEAKPKAEFANAITQCKNNLPIGTFAKIVYHRTGMGRNKLFEWLRHHEYLMNIPSEYNKPTQKAINLGILTSSERISKDNLLINVSVTPKGQLYIYRKLANYKENHSLLLGNKAKMIMA